MRKITYQTNRFDGGMTDAIRDTSNPTKFAYISHFDIYRDPNQMYVMPGFESFNGFSSDANGIKVYDPKDVALISGTNDGVLLLAEKSDGTGSKLFIAAPTATEWSVPTTFYPSGAEGADNLVSKPFLYHTRAGVSYYPVVISSNLRLARVNSAGYNGTWDAGASHVPGSNKYSYIQETPGDFAYFTAGNRAGINRMDAASVVWDAKTTTGEVRDISPSNYTVGIVSTRSTGGRIIVWDDASLLADQRILVGIGSPSVVGNPAQIYSIVVDEFLTGSADTSSNNGIPAMSLKVLQGESIDTFYRTYGFRHSTNDIYPVKTGYKETMTWYARYATNSAGSTFEQGVWAFGKGGVNDQMAISKLIETSSLGAVSQARWIGDQCWFINHSGDGSVSRLQRFDTGTYNVPATIETLVYGANSPYLKELNGISVVTENLPASASVKVDYRTDVDSAWVELGTSNTTNKQKHVFTRAQGTPIGRFQEIQFRITCTGKIVLKNIKIDITETDDLSF